MRTDNTVDFQEYMIVPVGAEASARRCAWVPRSSTRSRRCSSKRKLGTGVGDEGGFAPDLKSDEEALRVVVEAIEAAGYAPGKEIALALDRAARELFDKKGKTTRSRRAAAGTPTPAG